MPICLIQSHLSNAMTRQGESTLLQQVFRIARPVIHAIVRRTPCAYAMRFSDDYPPEAHFSDGSRTDVHRDTLGLCS